LEELGERGQAAGRGSNADDGELPRFHGCDVGVSHVAGGSIMILPWRANWMS
jgi:hypothetical protein